MFGLGQKVVDQNGGVFSIESIQDKDFGSGAEKYFILCPCFTDELSSGFRSYVPLSKAEELIRPVRTKDEIETLFDGYLELVPVRIPSARERKAYLDKVVQSKDVKELLKAVKGRILYREERKSKKKILSDYDRFLFERRRNLLKNEVAASMDWTQEQALSFLKEKRDSGKEK